MEAEIALDYDLISAAHGRNVLLLARVRATLASQASRAALDGSGNQKWVVVRNLAITITGRARLLRQVSAFRENQQGNNTIYRLEDLYQDQRKNLLVQLSIPPQEKLGEAEIARLLFEYDEVEGAEPVHQVLEHRVFVKYVPDNEAVQQPPDSKVVKADLMYECIR